MTVREELEWQEHKRLNPLAAFADQSRGRLRFEEPRAEDVRTCYQRDIDRIVHSKSFRRLMHKTQVFLQPEGDHYRTRMTHTLEVSRIAGTITRALGLNEDLAEAIAVSNGVDYRKAGYSKKFLSAHESEIILHKAAKQFFDEQNLKKLPTVKSLQAEYSDLLVQKKLDYAALAKAREEARHLQIYKANAEMLLRMDTDEQRQTREQQQEK